MLMRMSIPPIYFKKLSNRTHEGLEIVWFNHERDVLALDHHSSNEVDQVHLSIRPIIARAIALNARSMMIAHNHPSGDATPGPQDYRFTRQLCHLLRALDVQIEDHLIFAGECSFSFRDAGLL
jgi:DNA repair protein RadC